MRLLPAVLAAVCAAACASSPPTSEEVVRRAREVPVVAIDGSVAEDQRLEDWLSVRALDGVVAWESHDCGAQTGDPATTPDDFPVCAQATFSNCRGVRSSLALAVGTFRQGIFGRAEIAWATTGDDDASTLAVFAARNPVCAAGRAPN
jgi:hypothetical protein